MADIHPQQKRPPSHTASSIHCTVPDITMSITAMAETVSRRIAQREMLRRIIEGSDIDDGDRGMLRALALELQMLESELQSRIDALTHGLWCARCADFTLPDFDLVGVLPCPRCGKHIGVTK